MRYRREPQSSHFWSGFLFGAAIGSAVGIALASEWGRAARDRLETAVLDVRERLNGVAESPDLKVEEAEEERSS